MHLCRDDLPAQQPCPDVKTQSRGTSNTNKQVRPRPQVEPLPWRPGRDSHSWELGASCPLRRLHWGYRLWSLTTSCRCELQTQAKTKQDQTLASLVGVSTRGRHSSACGRPCPEALTSLLISSVQLASPLDSIPRSNCSGANYG